jgi:hypothetical protein
MSSIGTSWPVSLRMELRMERTWKWRWMPTGRARMMERKKDISPSTVDKNGTSLDSDELSSCVDMIERQKGPWWLCQPCEENEYNVMDLFIPSFTFDCGRVDALGRRDFVFLNSCNYVRTFNTQRAQWERIEWFEFRAMSMDSFLQ